VIAVSASGEDKRNAKALARRMLEGRLAPIEDLEERQRRIHTLREQLTEAERAFGRAYTAAETAGWPPAELKRLGFTAPKTRPRGRPRGRSTNPAAPTQTTPAPGISAPGDANTQPALTA
jgi:hypothetical protein